MVEAVTAPRSSWPAFAALAVTLLGVGACTTFGFEDTNVAEAASPLPVGLMHDPSTVMGQVDIEQLRLRAVAASYGGDSYCFEKLMDKVDALQVEFDAKEAGFNRVLNAPGADLKLVLHEARVELGGVHSEIKRILALAESAALRAPGGYCA